MCGIWGTAVKDVTPAAQAPRSSDGGSTTGEVESTRRVDVLIVSLGATGGLRTADEELLGSLRRAGASAALVRAELPRTVRTLMFTDLRWALASRRAAVAALRRTPAQAVVYSSTTAALLWPRPGAIRFDAPAAGNRPGRHGLWQRPLERRRLRAAPLLLPWSAGGLREAPELHSANRTLTVPVPVEPSGPRVIRDLAAFAYVANPAKKGLDRILEAWRLARAPGEQLVVAGAQESELREHGYALPADGVRVVPMLPYDDYRALLRRTRVFLCAARREDYGIAQLEALADGCMLVSIPSPGPYVALPIARELDRRLVGEDLARALRSALDDPLPEYAESALRALAPFRRAEVDRQVAEELLPRLLA
jgi:Glycosyl transferases group 1